jgi:hypothetical protein
MRSTSRRGDGADAGVADDVVNEIKKASPAHGIAPGAELVDQISAQP